MSCLKNYIGFKWCKATEPESGLWLNTLPGISLRSIDNLADEEQKSFFGVWNDIQDRAITKLNAFVANHFAKRYRLNTIVESLALGRDIDKVNNQTAAAAEYRGLTIDLGYHASPLQRIYVQSVLLYLIEPANNVTIKIFDVQDDNNAEEVYSLTRNMTEGWNTILISKTFEVQKLLIAYDATGLQSVYQPIDRNYPFDYCGGDCYCCIGKGSAYIRGAKSNSPYGGLEQGNNTFGISGVFGVQCNYNALVCANKNIFKTALWYLAGAEAMFERMHSDRLNRYTTVDRKPAEELYQKYAADAQAELNSAIEGIKLDCDSCIGVDAPVTLVNNLP